MEDDSEVVVDLWRVRSWRMGDEQAEQADHFLHGAVRVIEEGTFLVNREFVGKSFAGGDGLLADEGDAVLFDGDFQAMPVHGGALRECVFDVDANAIALCDLDGGAGAGTVVTPGVNSFEGCDFALHRFGAKVEDFGSAVETEGQIGDVGSLHEDGWMSGGFGRH